MKLSCCAYSFRQDLMEGRLTLEQFLEAAARMGFEGVELTAYYFPETTRAYLHRIKRLAHRLGLTVSGTAIRTDFASPDPDAARVSIETTREWLEHSVELGAPTMRVFAGAVRDNDSEAEAARRAVDSLGTCAQAAERCGVIVALENHHGLTATAGQTVSLIEAVASDWLGLNLDFGNYVGDIYGQFETSVRWTVCAHAKRHFHGETGPARVDYARVRRILDRAGYRGWVAIEYEDPEDPWTAVPGFASELRAAFA